MISAIAVCLLFMTFGCHFHALTIDMRSEPANQVVKDEIAAAFAGNAPIPTMPTEDARND